MGVSLNAIFGLVCFIGLGIQCYLEIEKYLRKRTIISSRRKPSLDLRFPGIIVCTNPYIKTNVLKSMNLSLNYWNFFARSDFLNVTEHSWSPDESIWNKTTFRTNEVIEKAQVSGESLQIKELPTLFNGNCFTLHHDIPIKSNECLTLMLKSPWDNQGLEEREKFFLVFLVEPGYESHMIRQDWQTTFGPEILKLEPESFMDLDLIREVHTFISHVNPRTNSFTCKEYDKLKQMECLDESVSEVTQSFPCKFPIRRSFTESETYDQLPYCQNISLFQEAYKELNFDYNECPRPCAQFKYEIKKREFVGDSPIPNKTFIYMWYGRDEEVVVEEYLVVNFSSLVASLGGSLGLFCGISIFGVLISTKDFFKAHLIFKRNQKIAHDHQNKNIVN